MSYSDFTLEMLRRSFGITVRDQLLFDPVGQLDPSPWLRQSLGAGADLALVSEKARSEFIVAPILVACRELLANRFHVFSGVRLDADPGRGLKGECDFILARSASSYVMQAPLLFILEAKKNDIEEGLGQCAAQMFGAKLYNLAEGSPSSLSYGCVTTGEAWQFLMLHDTQLHIHPERFFIGDVGRILWFLVQCLTEADRHVAAEAAA